jgi:biotin--protein ligase
MNVLVYSGAGVSQTSLSKTRETLHSFLADSYSILSVSAKLLAREPWEASCALLVIPGGRDLPYLADLGAEGADTRIARYVREGGKYLGICAGNTTNSLGLNSYVSGFADVVFPSLSNTKNYIYIYKGAYYACRRISFEPGTPMEVVGDRPLRFFPGECHGTAFPGFVYESEAGARSARLDLNRTLFSHHWSAVPDRVRAYYNGGGVFVFPDADSDKGKQKQGEDGGEDDDVQVLAKYADGRVAGVKCGVGKGVAVLWSVHPEHELAIDDDEGTFEPAYDERDEGPRSKLEAHRKALARATLSILGLAVADAPLPAPKIKPQYLISSINNPRSVVSVADAIRAAFDPQEGRSGSLLKDVHDTFRFIYDDDQDEDGLLLSTALEDSSLDAEDENGNDARTKTIIVCSNNLPNTPLFQLAVFLDQLETCRRQRKSRLKHLAERLELVPGGGGGSAVFVPLGETILYGEVVTSTQTMLDKYVHSPFLPFLFLT